MKELYAQKHDPLSVTYAVLPGERIYVMNIACCRASVQL